VGTVHCRSSFLLKIFAVYNVRVSLEGTANEEEPENASGKVGTQTKIHKFLASTHKIEPVVNMSFTSLYFLIFNATVLGCNNFSHMNTLFASRK
jgi:hypothetical protein